MNELLKKAAPSLVVLALAYAVGSIWKVESIAAEQINMKKEIRDHYTKKEEFVKVETQLKTLKEDTKEIKSDLKLLLRKMR